ncbi:unnamed protein product [Menidia menidia]|uniref:(Atlantic silverside) hypothetical protein n=1 Tax=Menidia menidia TaxID=238744 RepID=A0A8S4AWS9_9TELE|nr:unnamed protein product [Menidia menidia]
MLAARSGRAWLLASGSASLLLLLLSALHGPISSMHARCDPRPGGRPLYRLDPSWPRSPELFSGEVFAVAADQHAGRVYVAQRGSNVPKLLVFSTDGDFLLSWNTSALEMPHGMFLAGAATGNPTLWITDVGAGPYGHCIKQFSPSGQLLQPAEIFVQDSGEMYIVDGDGGMNNRLLKLSRERQVLWMHGERGQGLAQFYIPHSVTVDDAQRVWVADRGNKRIQVFNSVTGDWLGTWGSCFSEDAPYSVRLTPDRKYFVVVQLNTNQISLLDAPPVGLIGQCRVVSVIQLADEVKPHLVDLDLKTGALFVAEIGAQQAQKFTPFSLGGE